MSSYEPVADLDLQDYPFRWFVDGKAVAQPRPSYRVQVVGKRRIVNAYVPREHPVHAWHFKVVDAWRASAQATRLEGPVQIGLVFNLERPKPYGFDFRAGIGDVDNLAKPVIDALNKRAWRDDAQICSLVVHKIVDPQRPWGVLIAYRPLMPQAGPLFDTTEKPF